MPLPFEPDLLQVAGVVVHPSLGCRPKPMKPVPHPQSVFGVEEDKTNASDMSINSSIQNNISNVTAKPEQNNASSILNIPAEALSNFNSAQPQRQQQLMQQQPS